MLVREPQCPRLPYILRPSTHIQKLWGVIVTTGEFLGNKDAHLRPTSVLIGSADVLPLKVMLERDHNT